MKGAAPEFKETRQKAFGGELAASIIFSWKPKASTEIWVVLHFVKDRNYALLRVYWSSLGRSPRPEECLANVLKIDKALALQNKEGKAPDYLSCVEGVADTADFALQNPGGKFYIAEKPPRDRIRKVMATDAAKQDLAELELETETGDWEGSDEWDNWDSVETYGDGLSDADIDAAVGETAKGISDFLKHYMLPFVRDVAMRFK